MTVLVPKLLHVVVQPVFVLVDSETLEVSPGPQVQPNVVPAAALPGLADHLDRAARDIAEHLASGPSAGQAVEGVPVDVTEHVAP